MAPDPLQILAQPRFARLWQTARGALERRPDARSVSLRGFTETELEALRGLLNEPLPRAATQRLQLSQLDGAIQQTAAAMPLRAVLEALGGPLRDRRAERDAQKQARGAMWQQAQAQHPRHVDTIEKLRQSGALTRAADGLPEQGALLEQVLALAERLPARGTLLQELAADITGSTHGLDADQPLGRLALRVLAWKCGLESTPSSALGRRRLWDAVGVRREALSSHVLCSGLRPLGDGRLAQALRAASEEHEPQRMTLRELRGSALQLSAGQVVYICENPGVVSEAAAHRCRAPLVCTEGVPSEAAMTLLRQLARHHPLRFQADLDAAGVRIGNLLMTRLGAAPWHMMPEDYLGAVESSPEQWPLTEPPGAAAWCPELQAVMSQAGMSIFEEQLLDVLVEDLDPSP